MRNLRRLSALVSLVALAGALALALSPPADAATPVELNVSAVNSDGPAIVAAKPPSVHLYTVATAEADGVIPSPGDGTGNLTKDAVCGTGDLVVGGGHIIHPSSTSDMFITKSYPTDTSGDFTPPYTPDRWRVKVLNPEDQSGKKLTAHAVCARGGDVP